MIIPQSDLMWAMEQKPAVIRLFHECWLSDPYGVRWMPLTTSLKDKTLKQAKAALRNAGLFDFKSEMRILEGKRYYETLVLNLHGSRRDSFWNSGGVVDNPTIGVGGVVGNPSEGSTEGQMGTSITQDGVVDNPTSSTQTQSLQAFQNATTSYQNQDLLQQQINNIVVVDDKGFDKEEEEVEVNLSAPLSNSANTLHQEPTPLSPDQSFAAPPKKNQPTAEEVQKVIDRLEGMGVKPNHTVVSVVKNYYGNVENAIAHMKERQEGGEKFVNAAGAFVKAVKEKAMPSNEVIGQSSLDVFKQWYPLAKSLDLVMASMRDNGRLYVFDQDGVPHLFEKMLAEYPIDVLRKKTEERAAERVECPPELRRQLRALFQLP